MHLSLNQSYVIFCQLSSISNILALAFTSNWEKDWDCALTKERQSERDCTREWEGEEVVEYNRLISEQSAPAKRRMESRKDRRDKEKRKCREEKERREIKHAFSSLKGLRCFWRVSVVYVCVSDVCVFACTHSRGCVCDDVTLLIADMFAASASKPNRWALSYTLTLKDSSGTPKVNRTPSLP